jgi:hypothetical protein
MVIYRGVDGKPGYHQTDDIHDAVGFVEQMRNEEGVQHARIFRLEEVVFDYRPYYRVELHGGAPANVAGAPLDAGAAPPLPPADLAAPAVAQVDDLTDLADPIELTDDVIDVADSFEETPRAEAGFGKKGLFGR